MHMRRVPVRVAALPMLLALLLFAACHEIDVPDKGDFLTFRTRVETLAPATKAAPVTTPGDQFSVWGYVYADGASLGTPGYLCGEVFSKVADNTYQSASKFDRIPVGYRVKYWAVTPVSALTNLPIASTAGSPSFTYVVPADPADQADLLVASPAEQEAILDLPTLAFGHVLSGVQFCTASTFSGSCTIKSIALTGVVGKGMWTDGSGWSLSADAADVRTFTVTHDVTVSAAGTDVYTGAWSMMLLPQTLGADSELVVTYELTAGDVREARASLSGLVLPQGSITMIQLGMTL